MRRNTASNWRGTVADSVPLFLGIDIGTSGVRSSVIDESGIQVSAARVDMPVPGRIGGRPCQNSETWWAGVKECIHAQAEALSKRKLEMLEIHAIAVDGTSGSMVLVDRALNPVTPGMMYNSAGFLEQADRIARVAPNSAIMQGSGSALARLLFLQDLDEDSRARHCLHQADWIVGRLLGWGGVSDENNVLKLGYDLGLSAWPEWMQATGLRTELLPEVHPVGDPLGSVSSVIASEFGFSRGTLVVAGTTDGNAAFLASGASRVGDGVSSLGSTLTIKLLCDRELRDSNSGAYSHRIGSMWLAGGASNSGGSVLRSYFSDADMDRLEAKLDPDRPTGLDYYPLLAPGERFPVNDPDLPPRLAPRPKSEARFLQGLLEGIAAIEARGYSVLSALGAPCVKSIYTTGGGAKSKSWNRIRARALGLQLSGAVSEDASYGTARIAAGRFMNPVGCANPN